MDRRRSRRGSHATDRRARVLPRLLGGLAVVLVVALGGGAFAAYHLQNNIRTVDVTPALGSSRPAAAVVPPKAPRPVNILLMGSDSRDGANAFIGGKKDGARSDTTVLVHLSADRTWAVAASIPRDSVVAVPECADPAGALTPGSVRMFNDAFTTGGPACTIKAVESLTSIRIDHYVVVDFAGFTGVVDALGTVPICLAEPVDDPQHGIRLPAGRSRVDGTTALAYVRARYKLGDGSDLGRIDRQQAFLSSVLQEATSAGTLTNPVRLYGFLNAATRSLTMDPGLSGVGTVAAFARDIERVGLSNIQFVTVPNGPDPDDPNRLVWLPSAQTLWTAIRTDTPITTADTGAAEPSRPVRPSPTASPSAEPSAEPSAVPLKGVTSRTADADICAT